MGQLSGPGSGSGLLWFHALGLLMRIRGPGSQCDWPSHPALHPALPRSWDVDKGPLCPVGSPGVEPPVPFTQQESL